MSTPIGEMSNYLSSQYWVHFEDHAGRQVYVLSGTCILNPPLVGPSDGSRWQRGSATFFVPFPELPVDQGLIIENWAPTVVMASIQNDEVANNAGWAVDDFNVVDAGGPPVTGITAGFNYAVGDTDGYLERVAYSITVVGSYAPLQQINVGTLPAQTGASPVRPIQPTAGPAE
jgi:hypothetical protein